MAKRAARDADLTLNSVSLEEHINDISLKVKQETPEVTAFADAGPRRVAGNYDWDSSIKASADFVAGSIDATLFGLLGSAGVTFAFDPTGATAAANDPNYDGTVLLGDMEISAKSGGAAEISASLVGASALARAVA
jgi:hypothetical protein